MQEEELPGDERFFPVQEWAKPKPPIERPAAPDPSEDPEWGRLSSDCLDCGGRYGHEAMCSTGIERDARLQADPRRIAMIRRILLSGVYDPRDEMLKFAEEYEEAGELLRSLKPPGDWPAHYRAVVARLEEIMPPRTVQEIADLRETAIQYLNRPCADKLQKAGPRKPKTRGRGAKKYVIGSATLFSDQVADSLGDE